MKTNLLKKLRSSIDHPFSFPVRLTINFIASTALPVLLSLFFVMHAVSLRQEEEIVTAARSHAESVAANVASRLQELQYITLVPYYDENFSIYLSQSNTEKKLSYSQSAAIRRSLGNTIDLIRFNRTDLQSVLIVFENRCLYHRTELLDAAPIRDYDYRSEDWYTAALEAGGSVVFIPPHIPHYYDIAPSEPVFSLVKSLVNLRTRHPYGVIKVDAKASLFQETLERASFTVGSRVLLSDANGAVIYASPGLSPSLEGGLSLPEGRISLDGWDCHHVLQDISPYGWTLHIFLDQADINVSRRWIFGLGIVIYLTCVLFMLISYNILSRNIVRSISAIRATLDRLRQGDLTARYAVLRNDELSAVGQSINGMADRIEELIENEYSAVLHRQEAELRALQSQIQPHFFFNVIGNLIALNQLGSRDDLEASLFSLSRLMRYVLDKRDLVSLAEEVAFLKDYISLQKLRFSDKLSCVFTVSPGAEGFRIPRLCLQPYVENAIIHGIEPCEHPCTVSIEASLQDDALSVRISDDGVGFVAGSPSGIGIQNSRERLTQYYPGASVSLRSPESGGCTVNIFIPGGKT